MICNFPSGYTLVFSGYTIGDHIWGINSEPARATEINVRQNFWASRVILDGTYPAIWWKHRFNVYDEFDTPLQYTQAYFNLATLIGSHPQELILKNKDSGETLIAFGRCYIQPPQQKQPEDLLIFQAGIYQVEFWATEVPSTVANSP